VDATQYNTNWSTLFLAKKIKNIKLNQYVQSTSVFLLGLLFIKLLATLGAVFIYAKVTPFNDADHYYLNTSLATFGSPPFRTAFTIYLFWGLKYLLHYNLLVHGVVSMAVGLALWFVIKPEYEYVNKKLLYACLCLPHFLIWTGVVGKEALAIIGFLFIIRACIDLVVWHETRMTLLSVGLFLALIERPHFTIAYICLVSVSFVVAFKKEKLVSHSSVNKSLALFLLCTMLFFALSFLLLPVYGEYLLHFMAKVHHYFSIFPDAKTTRTAIAWSKPDDFFANLPWGVPVSIIGPTWLEALKRAILLPVFVEGCIAFFLLMISCWLLVKTCKKYNQYRTLIIWGFLPALVIGLLMNYPFGIFNIGSMLRYKQSLAPLLYLYPVLLIGAIEKRNAKIRL